MSAPVEPGQILADKYRVERVLGEGGMGVVLAALDVQLERKVAIKFLLPQYAEHTEAAERFLREARAAVKIKSEHIARVIDVGSLENGSPYMVMEFLEGSDLSQLLVRTQRLEVATAVSYVLQAMDAIGEAHVYGIIHRDLKPANLFLAEEPDGSSKVKVLDFGISKNIVAAEDGTDPALTRTSSMMGSPLYMSPEQMRSTKDVDTRTDIWALGVILYELLARKLPFTAATVPELSAKILLTSPEPLTREDVPGELRAAIERALSKDPNQRFATVAEFATAIAPFGPRHSQRHVERIGNLLAASKPPIQFESTVQTTSPEPDVSSELATEMEIQVHHTATVSQWGNTQGLGSPTRSQGRKWWFGAGAAVLALAGGLWAFWPRFDEGGNDGLSAARQRSVQPSNSGRSDIEQRHAGQLELEHSVPVFVGSSAHERQAPALDEPNVDAAASSFTTVDTTSIPSGTEASAPPKKEASAATDETKFGRSRPPVHRPVPKPEKPVPKPEKKARAPKPEPVQEKAPPSLRDRFGSRK